MTHLNAMRLFHYDPFSVMPAEQSTVGALRSRATDVDTKPRSSGKPVVRPESPIRIVDLAERAAPKKA